MYKGIKARQFFHWSKKLFGFSLFSLYALMALGFGTAIATPRPKNNTNTVVAPAPATRAQLEDWRFDPNTLQLDIYLNAGATPRYFYLPEPSRLVVDIPSTRMGFVNKRQSYGGEISGVRVSQLNETVTRIVMDLAPGSRLDPNQMQLQPVSQNSTRWILRPSFAVSGTPQRSGNYLPPPQVNSQPPYYNQPPQPPSAWTPPAVSQPPYYNNQQPPYYNNQPPYYNNQQPYYNNQQPPYYNNQQPPYYNAPPGVNQPPYYNAPPAGNQPTYVNTLPPVNQPTYLNNPQAPFVTVPPLGQNLQERSSNNPGSPNNILPPATFPSPNAGAVTVPTINNVPAQGGNVIPFGEPIPQR